MTFVAAQLVALALGAPTGPLAPLASGLSAAPTEGPQPIQVPLPPAPAASECVIEGVFPGSGAQGQWTISGLDGGAWELQPQSPDQLRGVLERHVGQRPFTVAEGILRGSEARTGAVTRSQEHLEASVDVEGQRAVIHEEVTRETACPDTPRAVLPGDTWTCTETSRVITRHDGTAVLERPPGTVTNRNDETWTRLPDTTVDGRMAVVLEVRSEDRHERLTLDPETPWCPISTERLVAGHVVGTDRRVTGAPRAERHLPGREAGNVTLPRFGLMLLSGAAALTGLAFAIAWLAGRRRSAAQRAQQLLKSGQ